MAPVASAVFTGGFNPVIFQPAWFMRHGLVPDDEEQESVELEAIAPNVTSWRQFELTVIVQPERCEFHMSDEVASYKRLQDLPLGVFALLPHVPVSAFGINRFAHFQVESEAAWN